MIKYLSSTFIIPCSIFCVQKYSQPTPLNSQPKLPSCLNSILCYNSFRYIGIIKYLSLKDIHMKLAISGKGGVGKTTFAALLARSLEKQGKHVLAIDADPDANFAAALGIENSDKITPIAEMKDLVLERTGAKPGTIGGFFKLNPKVDDLPDALSEKMGNIKLMRLGGVPKG
ncbi:MAG: AAA family ATPase, partial [Deltaproteobacteria bacterium]|nr:AAA family ATPase [Deltaproteobacteria bacterium]